MNMPLIALLLKLHSRHNPHWTNENIIALAKKHSNSQQEHATERQMDSTKEDIDNHIMENNLQELLLMDEAEIIKNLKNN